ncbi:MAG: DUF2785 domain-containing protein [Kofleriaceae bacterium]
MLRVLAITALTCVGCATTSGAVASGTSASSPVSAAELQILRDLHDGKPPPAGKRAEDYLEPAIATLGAIDPEVRDGIGYELFARWLTKEPTLDVAAIDALRARLVAQLGPIPAGEEDSVLRRSFSALVLSVVAAHELQAKRWSAAELDAQVAAAASYAAHEVDLRGYLGERGWAHAAAHTADWIKMLGRHPSLKPAQAQRLLDAVADVIVRRHGYLLHHGEEDRLVAALRSLIDRGALTDAMLDAFLAKLIKPIDAGWPTPFDPALFAAQRNARAVLYALFTSLSFAQGAAPAAALARVRVSLGG